MKVWAVKRYNDVFEDAGSRKLIVPNYLKLVIQQDSEAFRWLMRQGTPGHAAFGDFIATVQILATLGRACRAAGVLYSSGRALGPIEIASRLGSIRSALQRSFDLLSDSQCGWLYETEWNPASTPQNAVSEQSISRPPPDDPPLTSHSSPSSLPVGIHARADRAGRVGLDGTGGRGGEQKSPVGHPARSRPETVAVLLSKLGVDGDALVKLGACEGITPDTLLADIRQIESDKGVRNIKRVLVERLCSRHGITLAKGGKGIAADVVKLNRDLLVKRDQARAESIAAVEKEKAEAVLTRRAAAEGE